MSKKHHHKKHHDAGKKAEHNPETQPGFEDEALPETADKSGDEPKLGYGEADMEAIEKMRNLHQSESERMQDENKNTATGNIVNAGTTAATIEIVRHATPASDASLRGHGLDPSDFGSDVSDEGGDENTDQADYKAPEGHDYTSGNSLTGAVGPKPFAPWDDAKAAAEDSDDSSESQEVQAAAEETQSDAAKPTSAVGPVDGEIDPNNAAESGADLISAQSTDSDNSNDLGDEAVE